MLRSNLQPPTPTMQDMEIIAQDMKAFKGQFKLDKFGFDPKMPGHATEGVIPMEKQPTENISSLSRTRGGDPHPALERTTP